MYLKKHNMVQDLMLHFLSIHIQLLHVQGAQGMIRFRLNTTLQNNTSMIYHQGMMHLVIVMDQEIVAKAVIHRIHQHLIVEVIVVQVATVLIQFKVLARMLAKVQDNIAAKVQVPVMTEENMDQITSQVTSQATTQVIAKGQVEVLITMVNKTI
jgi:adenylate kinase family enzyme